MPQYAQFRPCHGLPRLKRFPATPGSVNGIEKPPWHVPRPQIKIHSDPFCVISDISEIHLLSCCPLIWCSCCHMADAGIRFGFFGKECLSGHVWTWVSPSWTFHIHPNTYIKLGWPRVQLLSFWWIRSKTKRRLWASHSGLALVRTAQFPSIDKDLGQRKIAYFWLTNAAIEAKHNKI